MKQRKTLKQLRMSYIATVAVILLLLLTSQIIIQLTLRKEIETRASGDKVTIQALYAQAYLKNSLELIIDPKNQHWRNLLQEDMDGSIPLEKQFLSGILPTDIAAQIQRVDKNFWSMVSDAKTIIEITQSYDPQNKALLRLQGKATLDLFRSESVYVPTLVSVFKELSSQADMLVFRVQLAEICLFVLSVLTVFAEYWFVARPGIRSAQDIFRELEEKIQIIQNQAQQIKHESKK